MCVLWAVRVGMQQEHTLTAGNTMEEHADELRDLGALNECFAYCWDSQGS